MNVPALYFGTAKDLTLPYPPTKTKRTYRHHSLDDGLRTLSQFC